MSLRRGTTKQPRRMYIKCDEVATLALAMTYRRFVSSPSLEKLRMKAGKTMVVLSVMAGHKEIFAACGLVRALWPQMFPAQVLPDLQREGLVRQRSLSND